MVVHQPKQLPLVKGFGKLAQKLNYKYEGYPLTKQVYGVEYSSFELISSGGEKLLEELMNRTTSGDVVFDVGANTGRYSLPLATKGCMVYSFEPHPETYGKLVKNLQANEIDDNVKSFNKGLSDTKGNLTFHQSSQPARSSFNEYNAEYGNAEIISEITIDVVTIDSLVSSGEISPPSHIKVDVEGLGLEVLRGARDTIENHTPVIYFEPHEIDDNDYREAELHTFFEEIGYEIQKFDYPWVCGPKS